MGNLIRKKNDLPYAHAAAVHEHSSFSEPQLCRASRKIRGCGRWQGHLNMVKASYSLSVYLRTYFHQTRYMLGRKHQFWNVTGLAADQAPTGRNAKLTEMKWGSFWIFVSYLKYCFYVQSFSPFAGMVVGRGHSENNTYTLDWSTVFQTDSRPQLPGVSRRWCLYWCPLLVHTKRPTPRSMTISFLHHYHRQVHGPPDLIPTQPNSTHSHAWRSFTQNYSF